MLSSVSKRYDKQPAYTPTTTDHQPHPNYPAQKCKYDPVSGEPLGVTPGVQKPCVYVCVCASSHQATQESVRMMLLEEKG